MVLALLLIAVAFVATDARETTFMARHWKGMMWFGCSSGLVFILALMMNNYGYAIAALLVSSIGFSVYMIGEGGLKEPFGERQTRPKP